MSGDLPWWARLLRALGVTVVDIAPPALDPQALAEGRYVFLHDDAVSPLANVIQWAAHTFRLPADEAAVKVARVHRDGSAAFGPFAREDVEDVLARGRAAAATFGVPHLRFDTTPPDAG